MYRALPPLILLILAPPSHGLENVTVVTSKGAVVGLRWTQHSGSGASYDAFLGIPYGHVPARFQPPTPRSSWTSPLLTQTDGPVCPQPFMTFSEDCLYLNVFTPLNASAAPGTFPVVAYIHGSAFTAGSSSSLFYGPDFIVPQGVILVTMNYRLGAAGFLSLGSSEAPGNLGLLDTQLALSWIQQEISKFGGNPGQVTLAGQSAGSVMTMFHYLSNSSSAMFQRAIAHSGSALSTWGLVTADEATRRAKQLASAVGCDTAQNNSQILSCLQAADINTIVNHQNISLTMEKQASGNQLPFVPVIDKSFGKPPFFTDSIANLVKEASTRTKPLVAGFTTEEGIFLMLNDNWKLVQSNLEGFVPWRLDGILDDAQKANLGKAISSKYFPNTVDENKVLDVINLYTDYLFAYPTIDLLKQLSNLTYGYVFAYNGGWAPMPAFITKYHISGVYHGADIAYLFYTGQDLDSCTYNLANLRVRSIMVRWWTDFIKIGIPDSSGSWGKISTGHYLQIESGANIVNASDVENRYYNFWANLTSKSLSNASLKTNIDIFLLCASLSVLKIKFYFYFLFISPCLKIQ